MGAIQRSDRRIHKGWPSMKHALLFHKVLFVLMLIIAFFLGALNAGRADMLEKQNIQLLLMLDVKQLTEMKIDV